MITNKWIMGADGIAEALKIRHDVFVDEMNMNVDCLKNELDSRALNLIVYCDDIAVATGRLMFLKEYRIDNIAVSKQYRGMGFGDLTARLLLFKAFGQEAAGVSTYVPDGVQGFFTRYGFKAIKACDEPGLTYMRVKADELVMESKCSRCNKKDCINRKPD